jgi:hypothetical protein
MRGSSAVGAILLLAGCSTGPSGIARLGDFGSPLGDRTSYLAFRLFEQDGQLSGRAWSSYSSTLIARVTVTGTHQGSEVVLAIHPQPPIGLVDWRFAGTLERDTLKGVFSFAGTDAQSVELARVRTIPLGDYSLKMTGAVADSAEGWATFGYGGGSFRLVQTFTIPDRSLMVVFWNRRDRPAPGTYPVTPEGGAPPSVRFDYRPPNGIADVSYQVQSGTLMIEESDRYVLAGRYQITVAEPEGRLVTLTGVFNAGCTGNAC